MPNVFLTGREIIARYDMVEIFVKKTKSNFEIIDTISNDLISEFIPFFGEPSKAYFQGRWERQDFLNDYGWLMFFWPQESYHQNELLRIRITNTCKWDWEVHRDNIRVVGDILDIYGVEYAISKAEIAFDTLNNTAADNFKTSASIKWGRPNKLFNYSKAKYLDGGSPNGADEYMFRRECQRQTHSYEKTYKQDCLSGGKVSKEEENSLNRLLRKQ